MTAALFLLIHVLPAVIGRRYQEKSVAGVVINV